MKRFLLIALGLLTFPHLSEAQYGYPSGYGGYGYGGFGRGMGGIGNATDPAAGYMAGLGSFARGQGVYQVDNAKAQAINLDTMLKWNKALRARQKELRAEQQKQAEHQEADRQQRVVRFEIENGTTLNNLLLQTLEFDPGATKLSKASGEISPAVIREIPFEWDTEAITVCLDQLTAKGAMPQVLEDERFVDDRNAMRTALDRAIQEDVNGSVSPSSAKAASDAIDHFHDQFAKSVAEFSPGYDEASRYFSTLASLVRLLHDPSMKKILAQLEKDKARSLGELIGFMNAFNLRFGPATTPSQVAIYQRLVPMFARLQAAQGAPSNPPPASPDLPAAAKGAFSGMSWDQLKAHAGSR